MRVLCYNTLAVFEYRMSFQEKLFRVLLSAIYFRLLDGFNYYFFSVFV